jgi:phosphatidylserine/phosphatidylglycerophosphate/cardiolipin synthase-like enzyme
MAGSISLILLFMFVSCAPPKKPNSPDIPTGRDEPTTPDAADDPVVGRAAVLFHPTDPSLEVIGRELEKAESNIDIAMYSMDATQDNPVIQTISGNAMQQRIRSGELKIRMIFEGYGSPEDNRLVSSKIEALGVDVRWFANSRKVHHKFAVIDAGRNDPVVITGSANWSLGSMKNYDEAILILDKYPGLAMAFQKEFNLLWGLSENFGEDRFPEAHPTADVVLEDGIKPFFNSSNFEFSNGGMSTKNPEVWTLTRSIVAAIDDAQTSIKIATTRIVLRPVYNALLRAAARGVKVDILVNQDQYLSPKDRRQLQLADCLDEYDRECSLNVDFPWFLHSQNYPGKENLKIFIKFFSLNTKMTLAKQMHSKYLVVDSKRLLTGSFNWSVSAEYNHIENVIELFGDSFSSVIHAFESNYQQIFGQGRDQYNPFISGVDAAIRSRTKIDCEFSPMALTFEEIDYLLNTGYRAGGRPIRSACL